MTTGNTHFAVRIILTILALTSILVVAVLLSYKTYEVTHVCHGSCYDADQSAAVN